LNILDKLPKRLWRAVRKQVHKLAEATSRQECERQRDALSAQLRAQGQEQAATCLERDWALTMRNSRVAMLSRRPQKRSSRPPGA
jgi:hypothetical protein